MDDKKIIKLNIKNENKEVSVPKQTHSFSLHTNPILKKMFIINSEDKKGKFSLKDWFK